MKHWYVTGTEHWRFFFFFLKMQRLWRSIPQHSPNEARDQSLCSDNQLQCSRDKGHRFPDHNSDTQNVLVTSKISLSRKKVYKSLKSKQSIYTLFTVYIFTFTFFWPLRGTSKGFFKSKKTLKIGMIVPSLSLRRQLCIKNDTVLCTVFSVSARVSRMLGHTVSWQVAGSRCHCAPSVWEWRLFAAAAWPPAGRAVQRPVAPSS